MTLVSKARKVPRSFSVKKAHALQLKLASQVVRQEKPAMKTRLVAGVDVAYTNELSIGAATALEYDSLSLVESKTACVRTRLPYIPTLLSFREIHPAVAAIRRLSLQADVVLVDGQGIMHPYRFGFASHLGRVIGKPTIGVAKSPLVGKTCDYNEEGWAPILDKDEVVGVELRTKKGAKPVYVSIGHMISLKKAVEIVRYCTPNYRIPKPIRLAHQIAMREKGKFKTPVDKREMSDKV